MSARGSVMRRLGAAALAAAAAVWLAPAPHARAGEETPADGGERPGGTEAAAGAEPAEGRPPEQSEWLGDGEWHSSPEAETPEALFKRAERAQKVAGTLTSEGAWRTAAHLYETYGTRYPLAPGADEASVRRAKCLLNAGDLAEAFEAVRAHLARFPETLYIHDLMGIALEIGERWSEERTGGALAAFSMVRDWTPHSPLAARARLGEARVYAEHGLLSHARRAYVELLEEFPRSLLGPEARSELAMVNLRSGPGGRPSGAVIAEARAALRLARERARKLRLPPPVRARIDERVRLADEEDARNLLARARFYRRSGRAASARFCLERLIERHPKAECADEARAAIERLPEEDEEERPESPAGDAHPEPGAGEGETEPGAGEEEGEEWLL